MVFAREPSLTDCVTCDGHNGREVLEGHVWNYGSRITGWDCQCFGSAGAGLLCR